MARERLSIEDWQDRLADNFSQDGVSGGELIGLGELEDQVGAKFVETYHGHQVLSDSCLSFFLGTLRSVDDGTLKEAAARHPIYPHIFVEFLMVLRRQRAARILSTRGYLGSAYALLRDVKDRSIQLAALFSKRVTYRELHGIGENESADLPLDKRDAIRRMARIRLERRLNEEWYGQKSDLHPSEILELAVWADLFNLETHGSHLSYASYAHKWLKGEASLGIVKIDDELLESLYMNRFHEVSWMMHRLLVFLQTDERGFGDDWARKWNILDESLWQMQQSLSIQNKKAIGDVFVVFIDRKFPFDPRDRFSVV